MDDFDGNMIAEAKHAHEQLMNDKNFNLSEQFEMVTFREILDAISENQSYSLQRQLVEAVRERDNAETGFLIDNMLTDWLRG